jgi:YjbE family integral membrane protein
MTLFSWAVLWPLVQVIAIDALMAGDNAIVVGMVAAGIPAQKRRRVIVLGTMAAILMRIILAIVAVRLLKVIGLALAGGLLLAYVAYTMYRELRESSKEGHLRAPAKADVSVLRGVGLIAMADLSMSLDNVLAVAGAASGNIPVLVIGLLISVTLMAVAASALAAIIQKHRFVAWLGLLMVAYVAVHMIVQGSIEVVTVVRL